MRKIVSHTLVYLFFDVINKAIPFILLPYLTHRLIVDEFGLLELFNTYVALLTLLVMFGVDGWCSANFHKLERIKFARLLRVGLICIAIVALLSLVVLLLFIEDRRFLLAVFYAVGMSLIQLRAILFRLDFKTIQASVLLFLNVAASSILTIFLFESGFASFESRLLGLMAPICVLAVWSIYSLWKQFPVREMAAWPDVRQLLKFTLPLLPNGLINFVRFGGDKFFVAHYFGIATLAVFGVGYQFAMVANIFMLSLNQATMPFMMKSLASYEYEKFIKMTLGLFAVFVLFVILIYGLTPEIVDFFFEPKYANSVKLSQVYYLAYPLIFLSIGLLNMAFFNGDTRKILLITICASGVHFLFLVYVYACKLSVFIVPYGLVVSSLISLVFALSYFVSKVKNG